MATVPGNTQSTVAPLGARSEPSLTTQPCCSVAPTHRFVPNAQNATSGDITFRAWDQTSGTVGTKVDASTNGGATAFSTATEVASITVTAVNDAPTITNGSVYNFTSIDENTNSVAVTASTILTSASRTDIDTGALAGMAITTVSGTGTWQYSTDGTTWTSISGVSQSNALLITDTTQLRLRA